LVSNEVSKIQFPAWNTSAQHPQDPVPGEHLPNRQRHGQIVDPDHHSGTGNPHSSRNLARVNGNRDAVVAHRQISAAVSVARVPLRCLISGQ